MDFWGPSKKLLSDMNFLRELKDYDKDSIQVKYVNATQYSCETFWSFVHHKLSCLSVVNYA